MAIQFFLNEKKMNVEADQGDMPLLWYIRENVGLKGTKFGCGIGQCGACTVHFNGAAVRSCTIPLSAAQGASVTTIEGLASTDGKLHPVQEAWLEFDVPQCGYCQAGQIMTASAMLRDIPDPTDEDIDEWMTNICRCATYVRIRKAIKHAASRSGRLQEK